MAKYNRNDNNACVIIISSYSFSIIYFLVDFCVCALYSLSPFIFSFSAPLSQTQRTLFSINLLLFVLLLYVLRSLCLSPRSNIHTHTPTRQITSKHTNTLTHTHTHAPKHTLTSTHTLNHEHTQTHTHTLTHEHRHIRTHTRTLKAFLQVNRCSTPGVMSLKSLLCLPRVAQKSQPAR